MEWTLLRSTVARRLLLLFVGGALAPIALLTAVALHRVSGELHEQARLRLHRASKAAGIFAMGRLLELEAELAGLAGTGLPTAGDERFAGFASSDGQGVLLAHTWGPARPSALPPLSPAERVHLAAGKTLLRTLPDAGRIRILLTRRQGDGRYLTGEARAGWLLDISVENALGPGAEFCALDAEQRVLGCSFASEAPLPRLPVEAGVSGDFEWSRPEGDHVARYRSLFLEPVFATPSWIFVIAQARSDVLAPIAHFQRGFPAAVAACFGIMALLGIRQLRRRLEPVDALLEGTRLIADGRFDVAVQVESGDEFEELAGSFNAMAHRLGRHFQTLETLLDVDRRILSALSVPEIAAIVSARFRELHPCDALALIVRMPDSRDGWRCYLSEDPEAVPRSTDAGAPSPAEQQRLRDGPDTARIELDAGAPGYLAPLRASGARHAVVLPLFVKDELAGVIACGSDEPPGDAEPGLVVAMQVANQVALALANAFSIEENRVLAYYDTLTGLPNRLLFKEHSRRALSEARRFDRRAAICLLDIDGFKHVNDTLGHDAGDRLLQQAAGRVSRVCREGAFARLGGDEFTILLSEVSAAEDAGRLAERLLAILAEPFEIEGREIVVTASLGIALHPEDGTDLETLLRNADAAMYAAKDDGGGRYRFFAPSLHETALRRLALETSLRAAIAREEFQLFHQPIFATEDRRIVGAEALIRWQSPDHGLIPPNEFIPIAERSNLIVDIGSWVIRRACAQQADWLHRGIDLPFLSVNVAARQLRTRELLVTVRDALRESGISGDRIALELTERSLVERRDEIQQDLARLRELGTSVSIDDFGTGYSSLAYLKHFPVDCLKIDRCFVTDATRDPRDAAIVRSAIELARGLGLAMVAEGVETEEQLAFLQQNGCEFAQGYLVSPPLPADAFEKLLREAGDP